MSPTDPQDAARLDAPQDAAHWFARMHSGEATDEDKQAFEVWRRADPAHDRAYRNLAFLWQATLTVPEPRLRGMLASAKPQPWLTRRRFGLGLMGAGALATVAGVTHGLGALAPPANTRTLMTRKGERNQAVLPDGSVLSLNTDTLAIVRFDDAQRRIAFGRGEIFVDVRPDERRPFIIDAGVGQVTASGSRLNVRRDADALQVSVESGSALVESGNWLRHRHQQLEAGEQAEAYASAEPARVRPADVEQITAWQRGKVVFRAASLAQVVSEMNRYLPYPVHLETAHLSSHRVSGVFSVDDPYSMIAALPSIVPVRLEQQTDGSTRILAL